MASLQHARESLKSAASSLEIARQELEKTTIFAPLPGLIVLRDDFRHGENRKPRVGDTVWQHQPLLYLPDISSMVVKTLVREVDLHKVVKGNPARVKVDAYPDHIFAGVVESIGILALERYNLPRGEKYFQVVVAIEWSDERLRPGMTGRAEILSDFVDNAVTVPLAALFEENGRTICFVSIGQSYEIRQVTPGRRNEDLAEITTGLKIGEEVSLCRPPQSAIRD